MVFAGGLTRPSSTSTRNHPRETTASKPVVPVGELSFHGSRAAANRQGWERRDRLAAVPTGAIHLSLLFLLLERMALVVKLLTAGNREFNLGVLT